MPWNYWMEYNARNRFGDRETLKKGDLVWLEPTSQDTAEIQSAADIKSLQWARWGRRGSRLLEVIRKHHPHMLPDCMNPDGKVDPVTDLFGFIPRPDLAKIAFPEWNPDDPRSRPASSRAGRVRPDNLVFFDAAGKLHKKVVLAPLAPPHPGCRAFYREKQNPDIISEADPLRGCKVYRTTQDHSQDAPWYYKTQGVYNESGRLSSELQKVNKTVDLLEKGCTGTLRMAVRSLSREELALLLAACTVDWRLGGGKPLGLGHCRVECARVIDEDGNMVLEFKEGEEFPQEWRALVHDEIWKRLELYQKTQMPVAFLRYPRAVAQNRNRIQRGGHVWFQRHAKPKMGSQKETVSGLEVMWVDGKLKEKAGGKDRIQAQILPEFNPENPQGDLLYGYDGFIDGDDPNKTRQERDRRTFHLEMEPFNPDTVSRPQQSGGNMGKNRNSRLDERRNR